MDQLESFIQLKILAKFIPDEDQQTIVAQIFMLLFKFTRGEIDIDSQLRQLVGLVFAQVQKLVLQSPHNIPNILKQVLENEDAVIGLVINACKLLSLLYNLTTNLDSKLQQVAKESGFQPEAIKDMAIMGTKEVWQ